jgi:hypothetical protein
LNNKERGKFLKSSEYKLKTEGYYVNSRLKTDGFDILSYSVFLSVKYEGKIKLRQQFQLLLRKRSISFAAFLPDAIALTTRLEPLTESPAANTLR